MRKVKVIQQGLGEIGKGILKAFIERGYDIAGAVDIREDLAGKKLRDIGIEGDFGDLKIESDWREILKKEKVDIFSNSTLSSFLDLLPELEEIIKSGKVRAIVSTCEELSFPYLRFYNHACALDELLKYQNVSLLATGVNPGFVMDTLPLVATAPCLSVERIEVERFMNAKKRREAFQRKIGAGTTIEEFQKLVKEGKIRHVGLSESTAMIAEGLGYDLNDKDLKIEESVPEPIIAKTDVKTKFVEVKRDNPSGVHQYAYCSYKGRKIVSLDFSAAVDIEESYDSIKVFEKDKAEPTIYLKAIGGVFGDIATISMVVNCAPFLLETSPGLKTMLDVPPRYRAIKNLI